MRSSPGSTGHDSAPPAGRGEGKEKLDGQTDLSQALAVGKNVGAGRGIYKVWERAQLRVYQLVLEPRSG